MAEKEFITVYNEIEAFFKDQDSGAEEFDAGYINGYNNYKKCCGK